MDVFLDPGDDRSTITQIHDQLRDAIADGRLPIGIRLTPSRVLAAELELSRSRSRTPTSAWLPRATSRAVTVAAPSSWAAPSATPNHAASYSEVVPTLDAAAIDRYGPSPVARYDLMAGRVDPRLFPADDWRRCVLHALRTRADAVGSYGDPSAAPRSAEP